MVIFMPPAMPPQQPAAIEMVVQDTVKYDSLLTDSLVVPGLVDSQVLLSDSLVVPGLVDSTALLPYSLVKQDKSTVKDLLRQIETSFEVGNYAKTDSVIMHYFSRVDVDDNIRIKNKFKFWKLKLDKEIDLLEETELTDLINEKEQYGELDNIAELYLYQTEMLLQKCEEYRGDGNPDIKRGIVRKADKILEKAKKYVYSNDPLLQGYHKYLEGLKETNIFWIALYDGDLAGQLGSVKSVWKFAKKYLNDAIKAHKKCLTDYSFIEDDTGMYFSKHAFFSWGGLEHITNYDFEEVPFMQKDLQKITDKTLKWMMNWKKKNKDKEGMIAATAAIEYGKRDKNKE